MLRFTEFDLKTGQIFHERDSITNIQKPRQKEVEHSYLEYWVQKHGLTVPELFVAKFYAGVTESDRLRLEAMGRVLVYSNGKNGYFADPQTAALLTQGDEAMGVQSIYAADRASPHNLVAYGSLVSSDGIASTSIANARILVIDDESRTHGSATLIDRFGKPISVEDLSRLYDKMGDGTMLISPQVMTALITEEERDQIIRTVFAKAGISSDITTLAQDAEQVETALEEVDRQIRGRGDHIVTQFRAATTDLPGIIKGTMATSQWCERLGVTAVISKNDIKGDDGRLSEPGIKMVSDFWLNRKSDGQYGEQAVGPQVKGCIPEATLHEFNPRIKQQAQELAEVAADPRRLLHYYVEQKEKHRQLVTDEDNQPIEERQDWLYEVAKADRYGMLEGFSKINHQLARFLKGEWYEKAIQGVYVPSAMAQHHSQLQPWECCNKDLPHGAILAYYRSPFPNVGAAAIAINNTEIIRQADPEAYRKEGVAYLNPWTAKNIAITDFDRDANGYFCGYTTTVKDLPEQIRIQLQPVQSLPPAQQYEAGRALFAKLVQQQAIGAETRIQPAQYSLAVREFIERNAPECKPPEIIKQKKIKHPWSEDEPHSAALWRAWSITADNPTGKVANLAMTLQSFALETQYIAPEKREPLLCHVSTHYQKLLEKEAEEKVQIPSEAQLEAAGFPDYRLRERIAEIAQVNQQIQKIPDTAQRQEFVQQKLKVVHDLLTGLVNGPIAMNLQTAVDTAKSSRGIDEDLHGFGKAIAHKKDLLRETQKGINLYTKNNLIQTNTQEPIGWGVAAVNQLYRESKLPELINKAFFQLFPKIYTPEQEQKALAIATGYKTAMSRAFAIEAQADDNRRQDKQPTMQVITPSGNEFTISRLCDGQCNEDQDFWQSSGKQNWTIRLEHNQTDWKNPEAVKAILEVEGREPKLIGYVSDQQVEQHGLLIRIQKSGPILIVEPTVVIQPPYNLQNDTDECLARAIAERKAAIATIPLEDRIAYACALGHHSNGIDLVLKDFLPELTQQLQTVPPIRLRGLQHSTNEAGQIPDGDYRVRFSQYSYVKGGEERQVASVAVVIDGYEKQFGSIADHSIHLPVGTLVQAHITSEGNVANMQVKELLEAPPSSKAANQSNMPFSTSLDVLSAPPDLQSAVEIPEASANLERLTIVTDGACKGNPGPGGWGAILIQGDQYEEIGGGVLDTTNNRMEMTAGIEALRYAREQGMIDTQTPVTLISDSQYFIKGAVGDWKRKANLDLWADYDRVAEGLQIQFEWVRGHNGHELNERVDAIAQAFAKGQQPELSAKEIDQPTIEKPMADSQSGQQPGQQNLIAPPGQTPVDRSQVVYLEQITRDLVQSRPQAVFLFGDNLQGSGLGGQAGAMRGEPNAIGIPTKHSPSRVPAAFFSDADFPIVKPVLNERLQQIRDALNAGKTVYVPTAGFGTGLAQLPERAPQIYAYLQDRLRELGIVPPAVARTSTAIAPASPQFTYSRYAPAGQGYEVSTAGDKRFSAFNAKLPDGRTIEEAYQLDVKGYRYHPQIAAALESGKSFGDLFKDESLKALFKSQPPLTSQTPEQTWINYKALWQSWASAHPDLMQELRTAATGKVLTDRFASSPNSQARALAEILNETEDARNNERTQPKVVYGATMRPLADIEPLRPYYENDPIAVEQVYEQLCQILNSRTRPEVIPEQAIWKFNQLLGQVDFLTFDEQPFRLQPGQFADFCQFSETRQPLVESTQPAAADLVISGKPIQMVFPLKMHGEPNPLPVDTCFEAMRGYGRCHTTRNFEPYAAYNIKEGDIDVVYSGSDRIAIRVGEQYRITPEMIADPAYQQQWANMEKHSAQELQSFQGKPEVWGLKMEPLGDYVDGKIVPFPETLPLRTVYDSELPQAQPSYDAEALNDSTPIGAANSADPAQENRALHYCSRGELLELLSVANAIGSREQQERIKHLGLALREQFNQECGTSGLAPPMEYRHSSIAIDQQLYLQMYASVIHLKQSFDQMQIQQSQKNYEIG